MRGKVAKALRRMAEGITVGQSKSATRKRYQQLKNIHKRNKKQI